MNFVFYRVHKEGPAWEGQHYKSLLEALEAGIFSITWNTKDRFFEITEECDRYYTAALTPAQLKQLGQELIDLAKKHE